MPELEKAVSSYALDEYYEKAYSLVLSGKARDAFDLEQEKPEVREQYGRTTFGQGAAARPPAGRSRNALRADELAGGGQRRSDGGCVGHARGQLRSAEESALPDARPRALRPARRHDRARNAEGHAGGGGRRVRPVAAPRREHVRQHATLPMAATTGRTATRRWWRAPASAGELYGKSDETASSPKENPVHPTDLLATIYYALGIDPGKMVLNDLNQPRELVKGTPLVKLFS